jgi:hypothetical protein
MPTILRTRLALFALLGAFLIPMMMSSLRGLTHVLTCRESVRTPFTLIVKEDAPPEAVTSTLIRRDDPAGICGGLALDLGARERQANQLEMVVPITNNSSYMWRGTVALKVDGTSIPVDIGAVSAGRTETDVVPFRLTRGSHDVSGSLLIGP